MHEQAYLYSLASRRNGTLHLGSTDTLARRAWERRNGMIDGFTKRYGCKLLVWYEPHEDLIAARQRECRMKECKRAWKIREIEGLNPDWDYPYDRVAQSWATSRLGPGLRRGSGNEHIHVVAASGFSRCLDNIDLC